MNFKVFNYEIIEFLCDLIIILKFENVKREENVSFRVVSDWKGITENILSFCEGVERYLQSFSKLFRITSLIHSQMRQCVEDGP